MQDTLFEKADAGVSLSDSGCMIYSIRQWMQDFLSRGRCKSHSIRQEMQESLYQTSDAGLSLSLFQTADAGVTIPDSGCRRHSIRHPMQDYIYKTADAGLSSLDSECRSHYYYIRQQVQENK